MSEVQVQIKSEVKPATKKKRKGKRIKTPFKVGKDYYELNYEKKMEQIPEKTLRQSEKYCEGRYGLPEVQNCIAGVKMEHQFQLKKKQWKPLS